MKNIMKVGSSLLVALMVFLSSGCGCALKESKIIERSTTLKGTSLEYDAQTAIDYTATYKIVINNGTTQEIREYTVKRDMDSDTYYMTTKTGTAKVNETVKFEIVNEKLYMDGEIVKYQKGDATPISLLQYNSPARAYPYMSLLGSADYHSIINVSYEDYKSVPFNACTPEDVRVEEDLPDILVSYIKDSLSCEAKRKLFSKETTYTVKYRVSTNELTTIEVQTDKYQRISKVNQVNNIVVPGQASQTVENITYSVSFEDVK